MDSENKTEQTTQSTQENIQQNAQLEACQAQLNQFKTQLGYLSAEFDNFRKRTDKERASWVMNAQSTVIMDILSIADDFDRALLNQKNQESTQAGISGLELIRKSIDSILKKYDVQEIAQNLEFDPVLHEAIMQADSQTHQSGQIVSVLQKGYILKGQVLRPAKVSVAK